MPMLGNTTVSSSGIRRSVCLGTEGFNVGCSGEEGIGIGSICAYESLVSIAPDRCERKYFWVHPTNGVAEPKIRFRRARAGAKHPRICDESKLGTAVWPRGSPLDDGLGPAADKPAGRSRA